MSTSSDEPVKDVQDSRKSFAEGDGEPGKSERPTLSRHSSQPEQKKHFAGLFNEICLAATICSVQLVVLSCLGQGIALIPFIKGSFGSTSAEQAWYTAAFSLTQGTFILPAGRLGDVFGHKKVLIYGTIFFALWSLVAGFSVYSGQILFDICRTFQGLGAALMYPNATAVLGKSYAPGMRKSMIMSIFGACAPNGFLLGALFGGLLAEFVWWPWSFWVLAVASCILALTIYFVVPAATDRNELALLQTNATTTLMQRIEQLDVLGSLSGVAGLVLINFSLNQGPIAGWSVPYTYALLIIGFLCIGFFFWIELSVATNPLLPVRKLKFTSSFALACLGVGWSSFGIWVYYEWQLFQNLRHQPVLQSVAQTAPTGISGALASIFVGWSMGKVRVGYVMLASMFGFLIGNILFATVPVGQTYWAQTFVAQIVTPWGMDLSFPSAMIILSNSVPKELQGTAASLATTVQNYSIALSLGFAGIIESKINRNGMDILGGYRGAWYLAIGLDGIGVCVALAFVLLAERRSYKRNEESESESQDFSK